MHTSVGLGLTNQLVSTHPHSQIAGSWKLAHSCEIKGTLDISSLSKPETNGLAQSNAHLRQHCLHHRPCQPGNRLEGLCHNIAHQSNIAHPRQALWTSSSAWPPSTPSSSCWPSSCTPSPNTAATTRFTSTWLSAGNYFSLPGASVPAASTSPPPPHPHLPHWQRVTTSQQNITLSQTKSGNLGTWGFHKFGNLKNTLKKSLFPNYATVLDTDMAKCFKHNTFALLIL